jgi:pimeloyl-ACP methyl ester carboxylesterase
MSCDARLFGQVFNALSRDRAVMIAPITRGERIEEIASLLLDQLPQRFALAGVSMGGIVAMEILNRIPDRVTRLCLMGTSPFPETPQVASAREPLIVRAKAGHLPDVLREGFPAEFLAPGPRRIEALNLMYQMGEDLGEDVFVRQSRALQRRPDQQIALRKCAVPTLIVAGAQDPLTPVKRHQFMADLMPGAELLILEEAGHLPVLEVPEMVVSAMRGWLEQDAE